MLVLRHAELVDSEPVIVCRLVKVDDPGLSSADIAVRRAIFDGHAIHHQAVQGPVALDEFRTYRPSDFVESVFQRVSGERGVEPRERISQALRQDYLAVVAALSGEHVGRDGRAVGDTPANCLKPRQGSIFNGGFAEGRHDAPASVAWISLSVRPAVSFQ